MYTERCQTNYKLQALYVRAQSVFREELRAKDSSEVHRRHQHRHRVASVVHEFSSVVKSPL